jgi:hypothetical protein
MKIIVTNVSHPTRKWMLDGKQQTSGKIISRNLLKTV